MNPITDPQTHDSYGSANIADVNNVDINSPNSTVTQDYNQRILPRQISSAALRGTQNVGYGGVKIDGSNNQITIGSVTNSLGEQQETVLGLLNDNSAAKQSFGLKVIDNQGAQLLVGVLPDGNLGIQLIDAVGNEVMRAGFLPVSGLYGWAAATPGNTLEGVV